MAFPEFNMLQLVDIFHGMVMQVNAKNSDLAILRPKRQLRMTSGHFLLVLTSSIYITKEISEHSSDMDIQVHSYQ